MAMTLTKLLDDIEKIAKGAGLAFTRYEDAFTVTKDDKMTGMRALGGRPQALILVDAENMIRIFGESNPLQQFLLHHKFITYSKLEEMTGIPRGSLHAYARGKHEPSDERKALFEEVLGIPIDSWSFKEAR